MGVFAVLHIQTHLHQQECVHGFIYQDASFGEQISKGSTRAQKSTGTKLCVCVNCCVTQANPLRLRDSTSQLQISIYDTHVAAALPMYTQVAYFFINIYIYTLKEKKLPHT